MARQGEVMARVIEFRIPEDFHPGICSAGLEDWGKLLHFPVAQPVQEPWRALVAELQLWADWR